MYEQFFGLSENPFSLTPDPRFIFPSHSHDEALAHLRYWLEHREGFAMITGEVGTGKTTALFRLIDGLSREYEIAFITNSTLAPAELLEEVCRKFGVDVEPGLSKPALLQKIENFVRRQAERGSGSLLIIDEAQNFDHLLLEEVRLLSNIARPGGPPLLQIALVGQPELERKLGLPELRQLKQRIGVQYKIEPLTEEETLRYIHHRVSVAGGFPRVLFPPETVSALHQQTHGLPREINQVASQAMLGAYVEDSTAVRPEHVFGAIEEMGFESVLDANGAAAPAMSTTLRPTPGGSPVGPRAVPPPAPPPPAPAPPARPVVVEIKPFQPPPAAPTAPSMAATAAPAPPAPAPPRPPESRPAAAVAAPHRPRARVPDFGALPPLGAQKSPAEKNKGRRRLASAGIWLGIAAILGVAAILMFLPKKPSTEDQSALTDENTLPVASERHPFGTAPTPGENADVAGSKPLTTNPPEGNMSPKPPGGPAAKSGVGVPFGSAGQESTGAATVTPPVSKPAVEPPAPVTAPVPTVSDGALPRYAFHLQVASFAESLTAIREGVKASQATGLPYEVARDRKTDMTWWALYLGAFATREEAIAARADKGTLYPHLPEALVREPRRR